MTILLSQLIDCRSINIRLSGYVRYFVRSIPRFPFQMMLLTRRVLLVEQELINLPEDMRFCGGPSFCLFTMKLCIYHSLLFCSFVQFVPLLSFVVNPSQRQQNLNSSLFTSIRHKTYLFRSYILKKLYFRQISKSKIGLDLLTEVNLYLNTCNVHVHSFNKYTCKY